MTRRGLSGKTNFPASSGSNKTSQPCLARGENSCPFLKSMTQGLTPIGRILEEISGPKLSKNSSACLLRRRAIWGESIVLKASFENSEIQPSPIAKRSAFALKTVWERGLSDWPSKA